MIPAGLYLSTYLAPAELATLLHVQPRHDQNVTLWELSADGRLEIVRHWELERFSGRKHHAATLRTTAAHRHLIAQLLAGVGVDARDLRSSWGTPGLDWGSPLRSPDPRFAVHAMAHLFSVLASDTDRMRRGTTLAFDLDGGPDHMLGRVRHQYAGAVASGGSIEYFPVESPARLFNSATHRFGLEAGSLMALATACDAAVDIDVDELVAPVRFDTGAPGTADDVAAVADHVVDRIHGLVQDRLGPDGASPFSDEERVASAVMKAVHDAARVVMARNVERAVAHYGLDPTRTTLAMAGGFALNCPTNSWMLERFGFARFVGTPCANDSGQAIGVGLMAFHALVGDALHFRFPGAYLGAPLDDVDRAIAAHTGRIVDVSRGTDRFAEDITAGPVAWAEGRAEVGPRALGHRSLLCDPRSPDALERLNEIKRRQWWRPVAPVVLAERVGDFFDETFPSPYMLHTYRVRAERRAQIPAVVHIDGTARCQTVGPEVGRLHRLLERFHEATGVPMFGNTSMNDRGEPIVQTAAEVLAFCTRRSVRVAYLDGVRVELATRPSNDEPLDDRPLWRELVLADRASIDDELNPQALDAATLYHLACSPQLQDRIDLCTPEGAAEIRRDAAAYFDRHPQDARWIEAFVARRRQETA